jgi:hypothetical protein
MPKRKPAADVFLNVPYDSQFHKLYFAYIAGVSAFGLVPRATLQVPGGTGPRFNMPFELGLCVACERIAGNGQVWFVFEAVTRRLSKSLSDLNATDPYIHGGTVGGVFGQLCNCFVREKRRPTVRQMWAIYRDVGKNLPEVLRGAGASSVYEARVFRDVCVLASASADKHVS